MTCSRLGEAPCSPKRDSQSLKLLKVFILLFFFGKDANPKAD
jgi:hypothetical protein